MTATVRPASIASPRHGVFTRHPSTGGSGRRRGLATMAERIGDEAQARILAALAQRRAPGAAAKTARPG